MQVEPLVPANSGFVVDWPEPFARRFGGRPIKNVRLRVGTAEAGGDLMVTGRGIEGGVVYALGRATRTGLSGAGRAGVVVHVDLRPARTEAMLATRIADAARRRPKESISSRLRRATDLTPQGVALVRLTTASTDPAELAAAVKAVPLRVVATEPIDRAISSAGGVAFDDVDDRFMLRSRPGTFVAGEMLDWEAPTGGYLLQAVFATGVAAAHGVRAWLEEERP